MKISFKLTAMKIFNVVEGKFSPYFAQVEKAVTTKYKRNNSLLQGREIKWFIGWFRSKFGRIF